MVRQLRISCSSLIRPKTLDCAIYDLKDQDVVGALKSVTGKVNLRIAYDNGKQ
jgi:hypothetical protein